MNHPALTTLAHAILAAAGPPPGSPHDLTPFYIGVPIVIVIIFFIIVGLKQRGKELKNLMDLAGQLGFQLTPSPGIPGQYPKPLPVVEGRRRERDVRFVAGPAFIGETHSILTQIQGIEVTPAGRDEFIAEIYTTATKFRNIFEKELEDFQTGDSTFDDKYTIKTNDASRAKALLQPKTRERLLGEIGGGSDIWITFRGGKVRYGKMGSFQAGPEKLIAMMDFACDLAELATGAS